MSVMFEIGRLVEAQTLQNDDCVITIGPYNDGPENAWEFPTITYKNARGKRVNSTIYVRLVNTTATPTTNSGFILIRPEYFDNKPINEPMFGWIHVKNGIEGGKIRKTASTIVRSGKNIGRANETNVFCQTMRDALSMYNKELRSKSALMAEGQTTTVELHPPMLAKKWDKDNVDYSSVYVQKKYNGERIVMTLDANNVPVAYTRGAKFCHNCDHIKQQVLPILSAAKDNGEHLYLDGEMYAHGLDLQTLSGILRQTAEYAVEHKEINFVIYDCFSTTLQPLPFSQRYAALLKYLDGHAKMDDNIITSINLAGKNVAISPVDQLHTPVLESSLTVADTYLVNTDVGPTVDAIYREFLAAKYEGAMIRLDAPYRYGTNKYRSGNILKYKPVNDDEFKIVGYEVAKKGKAEGLLMIVCEAKNGRKFNVTPAMEETARRELAAKMSAVESNGKTHFENNYYGRLVTIMFDEYDKTGFVPQRARTQMYIRDDL